MVSVVVVLVAAETQDERGHTCTYNCHVSMRTRACLGLRLRSCAGVTPCSHFSSPSRSPSAIAKSRPSAARVANWMRHEGIKELLEKSERRQKRTLDQLIDPDDFRACRSWVGCPCVCWHNHRWHTKEGCLECKQSVPQATWKRQQTVALWKKLRSDDGWGCRVGREVVYNA